MHIAQTSVAARARESALAELVAEVSRAPEPVLSAVALERILRRHPKDGRGFFSKREILAAYRANNRADEEQAFAEKLRTCPVRTLSGVTPVTVLTKPFPCPGQCIFCPNDVRMPKSYLPDEPGCRRAEQNRFDPYLQTTSRLRAYYRMGHPTSKIELIVLGGTWSHYPARYQRWFVARCFEAMNAFNVENADATVTDSAPLPPRANNTTDPRPYNERVAARAFVTDAESANWARVFAAHRANETAQTRCVGLSLETRPDCVTPLETLRLRKLGATKIQIGVQSLDDTILAANKRGHTVAQSRRAFELLRAAGFKLQAHWMPNLLGATIVRDGADFMRLWEDPAMRPDELKIYPCSLIADTELMLEWRAGNWHPYKREELTSLLAQLLENVPVYCRVSRMIRDIPSPDIVAGNKRTNLREDVEAQLRARGVQLREIRAREVRGLTVAPEQIQLQIHSYKSGVGGEQFIAAEIEGGAYLAGFLRLSLPNANAPCPAELAGAAVIREVHVYGGQQPLGARAAGRAQHAGLGSRLVQRAADIARKNGYARLAVISAIGTRPWYRKLGFHPGDAYLYLPLA